MENSDEVLCGCVELFFTIRKEFKLRCRCYDGLLYFNSMKDYIEHWLNDHREPLSWPSLSSASFLENKNDCLLKAPTLVIKPSTRSFEIYCNRCRENISFDRIEDYITHFLENHQNLVKPPYGKPNPAVESSESDDSLEYVSLDGQLEEQKQKELKEATIKNTKNCINLENQQGSQLLENSSFDLVTPISQTAYEKRDSPDNSLLVKGFKNQQNLDQTLQADVDNTVSAQPSKLQRNFELLLDRHVAMQENATVLVSNKNTENVKVELVFHQQETLCSNRDIMASASLKSADVIDSVPSIALKSPIVVQQKARLLYFSQLSSLFQRISVHCAQEFGLLVEIGTLSIETVEKVNNQNVGKVAFQDHKNASKVLSNIEEILPNNSIESEAINNIKEEPQEIIAYNTLEPKTNTCHLEEARLSKDLIKTEASIDDEDTQQACFLMQHDSSEPKHKYYSVLPTVSNNGSELSSNKNDAITIASANPVKEEFTEIGNINRPIKENTSIADSSTSTPKRNTRSQNRKRKASNIDQENTIKKKIAVALNCTICNKCFVRAAYYEAHMKKFHPLTKCCLCKIDFKNGAEILEHLKMHSNEKQCPFCHESMPFWFNKEHLKRHFHLLDCKKCEFFTCIEDELKKHKLTCGQWVCKVCEISFKDATSFRRHAFGLHQNSEPFECGQCEQKFPYLKAMEAHQRASHQTEVA